MAEDEIRQRITVDADEAIRKLRDVSGAENELEHQTRRAGGAAEQASRDAGLLDRAWGAIRGQLLGLVAPFAGIGALTTVLRLNSEAMAENVRLSRELAQAQRDLLFLSTAGSAAELAAVQRSAEIVGGEGARVELTGAFAQFKSQTANLSEQQRLGLWQQMIETSLTTATRPTELVELFTRGRNFVQDPQQLQNIIAQTIIESPESNPAVMARLLPRVLPIGAAVGLQPAETAGLLAFAAGQAGSADEGATGLRNIIAALQGRGTPESQKILAGLDLPQGMNFFGQIAALTAAQAAGRLSLGELEAIGGRENLALFSSLLAKPQEMRQTVGRLVAAAGGEQDITRLQLERSLGENELQSWDLALGQAEARAESLRTVDPAARRAALGRSLFEEQLLASGLPPALRALHLGLYDLATSIGVSPEFAMNVNVPLPGMGNLQIAPPGIGGAVISGLREGPDIDISSIGGAGGRSPTINIRNVTHEFHGDDPRVADSGRRFRP